MFADRANWELTSNRLTKVLEELRRQKTPLLDLTESNPANCGFVYPPEIISALADPRNLQYKPEAQGMLGARQAICAYYQRKGISVDPNQVFLTASTSEAYSFLFRLLFNPGEQALFPAPSYPLFQFLADLNDVRMETYPLIYHQGWHIDCGRMNDKVSGETRAVVLVNPNNPTGSFIKSDELAAINRLCQERDLAVIADEVFLDYAFDQGFRPVSLAGNNQSLTFALGGLSKTLSLPQMKLAWIIVNGPKEKMDKAIGRLEIIADTYLSVNTPVQNAAARWLGFQGFIQKEVKERTRRNREYILKNLPRGLECLEAEGGWYAVLKLPARIDEEVLALELLEKDHVYIHPGYFFDFPDGAHAVISLLPQEDILQRGFRLIAQRIS